MTPTDTSDTSQADTADADTSDTGQVDVTPTDTSDTAQVDVTPADTAQVDVADTSDTAQVDVTPTDTAQADTADADSSSQSPSGKYQLKEIDAFFPKEHIAPGKKKYFKTGKCLFPFRRTVNKSKQRKWKDGIKIKDGHMTTKPGREIHYGCIEDDRGFYCATGRLNKTSGWKKDKKTGEMIFSGTPKVGYPVEGTCPQSKAGVETEFEKHKDLYAARNEESGEFDKNISGNPLPDSE